jgi:hypothetical protein
MENKTAVEWLYETLWKQNDYSLPSAILEQAKEMEREQLKDAVINTYKEVDGYCWGLTAEQYYKETFKSE